MSSINTTHGQLTAQIQTTFHVYWLTYAHNTQAGEVGLEGIVESYYGKELEMLGCSNDTDMSFNIKKKKLDTYDESSLKNIVTRGHFEFGSLRLVLQDLVNHDVLPEGCYVVTMSW